MVNHNFPNQNIGYPLQSYMDCFIIFPMKIAIFRVTASQQKIRPFFPSAIHGQHLSKIPGKGGTTSEAHDEH